MAESPRNLNTPSRRLSRRQQNCLAGCLSISTALIAFTCVAIVAASFILPALYRSQRPEMQAIWCNRSKRIKADFVCDWKPTPAFEVLPTMSVPLNGQPTTDPMFILTPATTTPNGAAPAVIATATPVGTEIGLNTTPFQREADQNLVVITATLRATPVGNSIALPSPTVIAPIR